MSPLSNSFSSQQSDPDRKREREREEQSDRIRKDKGKTKMRERESQKVVTPQTLDFYDLIESDQKSSTFALKRRKKRKKRNFKEK